MSVFDQLINQASGLDLAAIGQRVGLSREQVEAGARALLPQIADPQVDNRAATETVAASTGIAPGQLEAMVTNLVQQATTSGASGGALEFVLTGLRGSGGGQGSLLGGLAGALDRDGDGNPIDDVLGMFGQRPAEPQTSTS